MNLASFRILYPEFVSTPDATVTAQLNAAAFNVDTGTYGDRYDQAHGLLTAHFLALAPGAQMARLDPKTLKAMGATSLYETTTYGIAFQELRNAASALLRVF